KSRSLTVNRRNHWKTGSHKFEQLYGIIRLVPFQRMRYDDANLRVKQEIDQVVIRHPSRKYDVVPRQHLLFEARWRKLSAKHKLERHFFRRLLCRFEHFE